VHPCADPGSLARQGQSGATAVLAPLTTRGSQAQVVSRIGQKRRDTLTLREGESLLIYTQSVQIKCAEGRFCPSHAVSLLACDTR
jgi:hypothetical protein